MFNHQLHIKTILDITNLKITFYLYRIIRKTQKGEQLDQFIIKNKAQF